MLLGIVLNKKVGDKVEKDEILGTIHANDEQTVQFAKEELKKAYIIKENEKEKPKYILGVI